MRVERTECDRETCKTGSTAKHFHIFKERKADAAGGMENWDYVFDLCPKCTADLLQRVLKDVMPEEGEKLLVDYGIDFRVE